MKARASRRVRAWLGRLTGLVFGLYLLVFWGVGCADELMLHPSTGVLPVPPGARRLMISPGGETLELFTARTAACGTGEPAATVLVLLPNAGRAEWEVGRGLRAWETLPVEIVALNYPGYGRSPGKATLKHIAESSLAAFDWAEKLGRPVFIQAYSLGNAAALHVAAERPGKVAGLYLYAVPPLHELLLEDKGWWNLWLGAYPVSRQVPGSLEALISAPRVQAPAVYIIGTRDTWVPPRFQRRVAAAHAGQKRILDLPLTHDDVPETGHLAEVQTATRWLWEQGQGAAP